MWPITAVLIALLLTTASNITPLAARQEQASAKLAPAIERLAQWIEAVRSHQVGEADVQAVIVASWSHVELSEMFPLLEVLLELVDREASESLRPRLSKFSQPAVRRPSAEEIALLRGMAFRDWVRADPNRLLIRGGLLHADIARLVKPSVPTFVPQPARGRAGRIGRSVRERVVARAPDADYRGMEYGLVHWDYARMLLSAVAHDPFADPVVRLWYRATAAYLSGAQFFGEAKPHFEYALTLFPSDAHLLFSHACMQAAMASPGVQEFVNATPLPGGVRFDVSSARTHLRNAEELFRKALDADPRMVEARIRLARVRADLGRHEEAARLLTEAAPFATDPVMAYYLRLFLGESAVAIGQQDVAQTSFQHAAELFPSAQTPRVALSQLARSLGNGAGAHAALGPLFALPADAPDRYDPWWDYHRGEGRYSDALFSDLYRLLERPSQ